MNKEDQDPKEVPASQDLDGEEMGGRWADVGWGVGPPGPGGGSEVLPGSCGDGIAPAGLVYYGVGQVGDD